MLLPLQPRAGTDDPLARASEPTPLLQTRFAEANADISPDGRWLAVETNESGRPEVYVRPFPDVERGRWQVSTAGGRTPVWSRDGRELFYHAPDGVVMGVRVDGGASFAASAPVPIVQGAYAYTFNAPSPDASFGGFAARSFDVAADGRFLMLKPLPDDEEAPAASSIIVVQNWLDELVRRVPVP
jgi:serine/threonine-protein kinase